MKQLICILTIVLLLFGIAGCKNNSKTAHFGGDGIYVGNLPCADCPGIKVSLKLNRDFSFEMQKLYTGESETIYTSSGSFAWNESDGKIVLSGNDEESPSSYLVGDNKLTQLDMEGNLITGDLADLYILHKMDNDIFEKYWKLIELSGTKIVRGQHEKEAYIILKKEGNQVIGNGGCNTFSGTYTTAGENNLSFLTIASTKMACLNMETEYKLFQVFKDAVNYSISATGDTLSLNKVSLDKESTAPLAKFEVVYLR